MDQTGQRKNTSFLQPLERPILQWLAQHTPPWVSPNHLTVLGLIGATIASIGYILSNISVSYLWLASAGLVVNWVGDSLDGTLARYRQVERRRFGLYVDHATDLASQVLILLGLGLSPHISFEVACLALIAYLTFTVIAFLRRIVFGVLEISYNGIGPTELRIGLLFLNAMVALMPPWNVMTQPFALSSADIGVLIVLIIVIVVLCTTVKSDIVRLDREDPATGERQDGSRWRSAD